MTTDALIGQVIGDYEIQKLLGSGGMAQVYRGYDLKLQRYAAIKIIAPHLVDTGDYEFRFEREARAVAQLNHTNIVTVYRFGEQDGLYWMAMQYIDGPDLGRILSVYHSQNELMPLNSVLSIIDAIGKALDYAHSKGVIHRDIKPGNIMLTREGEVILTDFGLAYVETEKTEGDVFGSAQYIAPEQAVSSASVVPQSDLYSLGVTLYKMLTGSTPFSQGSAMQIAMSHISEPPPPPEDYFPDIHSAFIPILEKALAKNPKDRFTSGAAMTTALRKAVRVARKQPVKAPKAKLRISDENLVFAVTRMYTPLAQQSDVDSAAVTAVEKANEKPKDATSTAAGQTANQANRTQTPTAPQSTNTQTPANQSIPSAIQDEPIEQGKRRAPLLLVALIVIALIGGGSFFILQGVGSAEIPPVTTLIEGPVRAIDNNVLTIYDIEVTIPSDDSLLSDIQIGDVVWLEGNLNAEGRGLTLNRILAAGINDEVMRTLEPNSD